jgi:hypothetical protein
VTLVNWCGIWDCVERVYGEYDLKSNRMRSGVILDSFTRCLYGITTL